MNMINSLRPLLSIPFVLLMACEAPKSSSDTNTETIIQSDTDDKAGYSYGSEARAFLLMNIDSTPVSTMDYPDAKGFVVIFTCNHCPYAKAYEERMVRLNTLTSDLGYPVLAINPNNPDRYPADDFEHMKIRAKEKAFNFPYLVDEGQKLFPAFGATKTPHVYVLNKENNKLIVRYIGAIDDNYEDEEQVEKKYVEAAVKALSEGREVEIKETKAIGCSIKV